MNHANPNRPAELARNVEIALRFKQKQGTPEMPQVEKEVLAANYDRMRGGTCTWRTMRGIRVGRIRRCICARRFLTVWMSSSG